MASGVKKLYRSKKNKIIAGVCGGLAEYFGVDPIIVRVIYVLLTIFTAVVPFLAAYLVLWILVPIHK